MPSSSSANQDDMLLLFLTLQPGHSQRVSPLLLQQQRQHSGRMRSKKRSRKATLVQATRFDVQKWQPTNLEDLQAVLPLTLLDHGDEPHDDVERQQDPTRPQQVHLQSEASDNLLRVDGRSHTAFSVFLSPLFRQREKSKKHSSRSSRSILTVRRLKANWFAAPTVATVTRCLSSSTTVNCTHGQGRVQSSGRALCAQLNQIET